jgi:MarR family transcriptional regulator, organic hydroperoxide resistance regulator
MPELTLPFNESAGHLLHDLHKMQSRLLQKELVKHGVAFGAWYYLRVLWIEDGMTQHDLSKRVDVNDASTRTAIDRMEADGLVSRQPHPDDRRKICIFLTKRARDLRAKLMPIAIELNRALVGDFSEREKHAFIDLLTRAKENYETQFFSGKRKRNMPETPAT